MSHWLHRAAALAVFALVLAVPARAQDADQNKEVIVTIVHAAPGQQVALLHWLADREAAAKQAGVPAGQLYVHEDGDSWDFLTIAPRTTPEQDAAVEAAAKEMGLATGAAAWVEYRKFTLSHTDTYATGPLTPSDVLKAIGQ